MLSRQEPAGQEPRKLTAKAWHPALWSHSEIAHMQNAALQKHLGRLQNRWPLFGAWVRRSAIRALADDGSAEAIHTLTDGIMHSPHELLQADALPALWKLAHQQNA